MCKSCRECGVQFVAKRVEAQFCGIPCKNKFNNRRLQRGAELYDLFMAMRYQRGLAKALGIWTIMCALANTYRREDEQTRPGLQSWFDPKCVLARKPSLRAVAGRV